jgi:hypothetical protein
MRSLILTLIPIATVVNKVFGASCLTTDTDVTISTSVTTIKPNAYYQCPTIKTLTVASTVTSVGKRSNMKFNKFHINIII